MITTHVRAVAVVVVVAAAMIVAIAAPFALQSVRADHGEVTARAGDGESGYAVNIFLPQDITIHTGDTVTWDFPWFEPHSVTFGTPTGDPEMPSNPGESPLMFDGTTYFSSGLLAPEFSDQTTFSVQFTAPGTYPIYCAIHPFMTGTVTVVDDGETDTQEDLDARAAAEYAPALAALKTVGGDLAAAPTTSTQNADGTTTYEVVVSGATMQGDVMQFFPPSIDIKAGDTVRFENTTPVPHTATFNMQEYPGGDPFEVPRTDVSGGFDGTGFVNSGIIGVDFPDGTTFEVTFTKAGTYAYVCVLHANQGMVGVVNVEAAPEPTPVPPDTGTGLAATSSGGSHAAWYAIAGLVAVVASASVIITVRAR